MSNNRTVARVRFAARLFGGSVFVGLLGLAVTVAIISFLTACKCINGGSVRQDEIKTSPPSSDTKTTPSPGDLPVIPPIHAPSATKDN